ncbi:hypothetical protein RSSM_00142 [Rhodopirellula sallentina SM41]|uniref:Uncharacterized protein n=1 Tax=Rhodopirellula sallentina SM41 TaxID=1263870 RepID=M5UAG7_9BACT|nr:hypothetical protein RSSM_00142 [Rhodopirellula sallentina SM41]
MNFDSRIRWWSERVWRKPIGARRLPITQERWESQRGCKDR